MTAYTPPGSRATAAILALYVKVGACLLAIGADVGRIVTAGGLQDGRLLIDDLLAADRLVALAALAELVALVVAVALVARWWLVVRADRAALEKAQGAEGGGRLPGAGEPRALLGRSLRAPWLGSLAVAAGAVVASWTALGEAQDVADRQRIDALRAAATALSALAAGLTIVVVASVTRRLGEQAQALGLRPTEEVPEAAAEAVSEGGLRVVSEERARRPDLDA